MYDYVQDDYIPPVKGIEVGDPDAYLIQRTSLIDLASQREQEMCVDEILPQGAQIHLYSKTGVGKSLIALHLALSVAEGGPVFTGLPT